MYISDLKLVNFRNYENERIEFNNKTNILVGGNAQGKTNLLESVYYCSKGRSFKTNSDRNIIRKGENSFSLDAQIIRDNRRKLIHIESAENKLIEINGIGIDTIKEMKNQFEIVYFLPDHLRIVKDGPDLRRELVDEAIENIRPSFKNILTDYNRVLRQRNAKLKNRSRYFKEELSALTCQLISLGSRVVMARNEYISLLKEKAKKIHAYLTAGEENIDLKYKSSMGQISSEEQVRSSLEEIINSSLDDDLEKGYTTRGPHRDDLNIYINGMNIKKYASQGQQRSAILSIKLGEIEIIKEYNGHTPILLLDDVFSELDKGRRQRLLANIQGMQSLISSNDINFDISGDISIYKVKEGKIYND